MSEPAIRTYSELSKLPTFKQRFNYLNLNGIVGEDTFGFERYLNQRFYQSEEWKRIRREVIFRDNGCDLGLDGYQLNRGIVIHHMNPITKLDIVDASEFLLNPEYLICTSFSTHNAIHYGDEDSLIKDPVTRRPNDTCPWRKP